MNDLIARLIAAGTPAELVSEVAQTIARAEARAEVAAEQIESRRRSDRNRKARSRDVTGQTVTKRDVTPDPPEGPLSPEPPIPPKPPKLPLTQPSAEPSPPAGKQPLACQAKSAAKRTALDGEFEAWWREVPRKASKGAALKAYRTARKSATAEQLLIGIRAYAAAVVDRDTEFIRHPATWLNGKGWLDEIRAGPKSESTRDRLRRLAQAIGEEFDESQFGDDGEYHATH